MPSGVTFGRAEMGGAPCQSKAIAAPPMTTMAPATRATATRGTPPLRTTRGGGGAGTSAIGAGAGTTVGSGPSTPRGRGPRRRSVASGEATVPSPGRSGAIPGIATPSIVCFPLCATRLAGEGTGAGTAGGGGAWPTLAGGARPNIVPPSPCGGRFATGAGPCERGPASDGGAGVGADGPGGATGIELGAGAAAAPKPSIVLLKSGWGDGLKSGWGDGGA